MTTEEQLAAYQRCVNRIDDYLEYAWTEDTGLMVRDRVCEEVDKLTRELAE